MEHNNQQHPQYVKAWCTWNIVSHCRLFLYYTQFRLAITFVIALIDDNGGKREQGRDNDDDTSVFFFFISPVHRSNLLLLKSVMLRFKEGQMSRLNLSKGVSRLAIMASSRVHRSRRYEPLRGSWRLGRGAASSVRPTLSPASPLSEPQTEGRIRVMDELQEVRSWFINPLGAWQHNFGWSVLTLVARDNFPWRRRRFNEDAI